MQIKYHPKLIPRKRIRDEPEFNLSKGGIVIGKKDEGTSEHIYYVGEDSHLLCIGATRSGKSRCLVVPSICTLGLAGESMIISDPKAELYDYTTFCSQLSIQAKRAIPTEPKCWHGI